MNGLDFLIIFTLTALALWSIDAEYKENKKEKAVGITPND